METNETLLKGAGLAAYGVATMMLSTLEAKGIFTRDDVATIFETLLSQNVASGAVKTPEGQIAHQMLSSLAETAARKASKAN